MPYRSKRELPKQVRNNIPEHAQEIYQDAYNSAEEFYSDPKKRRDRSDSPEEVAAKVAWSAVKKEYRKKEDSWVRK